MLRREVNDRIQEVAAHLSLGDPEERFEVFCECGGTSCDLTVTVTFAEYAAIRSSFLRPTGFVVACAHEAAAAGTVLARHQNFVIVGRPGRERVSFFATPEAGRQGR
jgi:hypothetical protein